MKKVLIIFDTTYGNTEQLAKEIASGIEDSGESECAVLNQKDAKDVDYTQYDGVLFGGPVHAFRASRGIRDATNRACKAGLDGKLVAAFDTYLAKRHEHKGTQGIEKILRKKASGARLFSEGLSALVDTDKGPLNADEPGKAHEFGQRFAAELGS